MKKELCVHCEDFFQLLSKAHLHICEEWVHGLLKHGGDKAGAIKHFRDNCVIGKEIRKALKEHDERTPE